MALDESPSSAAEAANAYETSFLRNALSDYLRFVNEKPGRNNSPDQITLFPKVDAVRGKRTPKEPPNLAQIFLDDNPQNEFSTSRFVPLMEALKEGDLEAAWPLYKKIVTSPCGTNPIVKSFLRNNVHTELFDLVMRKGSEIQDVPPPIKLANDWVDQNLASPTFYSQLLVNSLQRGDLWQIEAILRNACRISPPYKLELAYIQGQAMDQYEDSHLLSAPTIDNPQIELWVLIYAAYCYIHSNSKLAANAEWPPPGTFLSELHHTIPQVRSLPSEKKLRDVLYSYGFSQPFVYQVLVSALSIQEAHFFTLGRMLKEDIKTAVIRRDIPHLKTLYEDSVKLPLFKGFHYNLFLLAFAAIDYIEGATKVWGDMSSAGIKPTVRSWNALLMGCGKARDMPIFMVLWRKMIDSGTVPDTYLWTTRIHALLTSGHIREGIESLREMSLSPITKPNLHTINVVVDGLMKRKLTTEAHAILEYALSTLNITPDLITFNILLKGYMAMDRIKASLQCLGFMEENDIKPDVVTCTIILNGLYRHSLRSGIAPTASADFIMNQTDPINLSTVNSPSTVPEEQTTLFSICTNLLQQMRSSGITANVNFYTVLIDNLLQPPSKNIHAALDILRIMQSRGIEANTVTYTVLVRHYSSVSDVSGIETCWRQMRERGINPDWVILEETIRGYARMTPPPELLEISAGTMQGVAEREFRLREWRDAVVRRMMFWLSKVDALNEGYPLALLLGDQPSTQRPPQKQNPSHSVATPPEKPGENLDDILPSSKLFFRVSTRTYKDVLGRLLSEERYEMVENVLEMIVHRLLFPPPGFSVVPDADRAKTNIWNPREHLEGLSGMLKVCMANGVRIPEELMRRVFR